MPPKCATSFRGLSPGPGVSPASRSSDASPLLPGLASFLPSRPERTAGVDEAGRGCLAGPVVAAAVILPPDSAIPGVRDSKQIRETERFALADRIRAEALAFGFGLSWPAEIGRLNILWATMAAMRRAVERLKIPPELVLVDGNRAPELAVPAIPLVKGDQREYLIAAASILAKTARDRIMVALDKRHPGYGFAIHKGYGTAMHREAVKRLGRSPLHRPGFRCGDE